MDPRRRPLQHHNRPPSPPFQSTASIITSRRYSNAPSHPSPSPRFVNAPSLHRSQPIPQPFSPPLFTPHNHDQRQPHLYIAACPADHARRKYVLEAAEMRHVFDSMVGETKGEKLSFVDHSQAVSNPRVSNRTIFPDGPPIGAASMVPRDGGLIVRDDPRDCVDERSFRVRVSPSDLRRGFPGRWEEEMESRSRHVTVEGGGDVVRRKRTRREDDSVYADGFLPEEGYDSRVRRKAGFWGSVRGGPRHQNMPKEREPPDASSQSLGLHQNQYSAGLVFDRHQCSADGSRDLEKSKFPLSDTFNVENRYGLQGQNRFSGKGKRVLFDTENIEDAGRKLSVLSRIQHSQPVWNRLEEQKHVPSSSSALLATGTRNIPADIDVGDKSNAFLSKEVLPSPPSGDLQNTDGRNGKRRNLKKQIPSKYATAVNINRKASDSTATAATTVTSNKSTTRKTPVSTRTRVNKKSDGKVIELKRSKKTPAVGHLDAQKDSMKSNENALACGDCIDVSEDLEKNNRKEISEKTTMNEDSVSHSISMSVEKAATLASPKVKVHGTCNAPALNSSDGQRYSLTCKEDNVKQSTVLPHQVEESYYGHATVKAISADKPSGEDVDFFSPSANLNSTEEFPKDSRVENEFSPGIVTMQSGETVNDINHALDDSGRINKTKQLKDAKASESLVSHEVHRKIFDRSICGFETSQKDGTMDALDGFGATSVPKAKKEVNSGKVLIPASTLMSDSGADVTPMHYTKKEVQNSEDSLSTDICQPKFVQITGTAKIDEGGVEGEHQADDIGQLDRENISERTSNGQASSERVALPHSASFQKESGELVGEVEKPFVSPSATLIRPPEHETTTDESSLKKDGEILSLNESESLTSLSCCNIAAKNLISPSFSQINSKNAGSSTNTLKNKKRRNKEKAVNPMVLSNPGSTHESCKDKGLGNLPKDLTSTISEEAQAQTPKKKRRKKKRKDFSPPLSLPMSLTTSSVVSLSPGKSCNNLDRLEEVTDVPCSAQDKLEEITSVRNLPSLHVVPSTGPECLEDTHNPLAYSSPCEELNNPEWSGKASLSVFRNVHGNSLEQNMAKPSIEQDPFCSSLEDLRNCKSPTHFKKACFLSHQDDVRESKSCSGVSLPAPGDSKHLADGAEHVEPFDEGCAMPNMVTFDFRNYIEDAKNSLVNNLVKKTAAAIDIIGREREMKQDLIIPSNVPAKSQVPTAVAIPSVITDIGINSVHTVEGEQKIQQVPMLLHLPTQVSINVDNVPGPDLQLDGLPGECNSLEIEKTAFLNSSSPARSHTLTEQSLGEAPKLELQEIDENVLEEVHPVQKNQPGGLCCNDELSNSRHSKGTIKRSASEPQLRMTLDKIPSNDHLVQEEKMSQLLQESEEHFVSSTVEPKKTSTILKDCNNSLIPQNFPHQAGIARKSSIDLTSSQNRRHRIWRRTDSSYPSQSISRSLQPKLAYLSSLRKQMPRKLGKSQGSYVRKGNSLIRKSSATAPPQQSYDLGATFRGDMSEANDVTTSENKIVNADATTCFKIGGMSPNIERHGSPPLPLSSKPSCCTSDSLSFVNPGLAVPSKEVDSEVQAISSKSRHLGLGCPDHPCFPNIEKSKSYNLKPPIYVKHKSNQLVATTGIEIGNSSSHINEKACVSSSSLLSDVYFMRKKNQLVRDTSLLNRHLKKVRSDNSKTENQGTSKTLPPEEKFRVPSKRKSEKGGKFSSVWRLDEMKKHDKEIQPVNKILPHIFPWKRASYWRSSMTNISRKHSMALISKKLQLSRKRDTLYTVSKGGFCLRKSGVRSMGRSNLTWSKSIERRSKKANKEATLAVAEVERNKREINGRCFTGEKTGNHLCRERVFRVGTVRYKMDSSRKTLIRIPDLPSSSSSHINQHSGNSTNNSFIPKRLLIGREEYIRIGNGNKLVRDPKRHVRMLASEKIRWSLHTARKRLARKQQYCQFFTRFGKCNKDDGRCPYIHDPSKVAICTKFLKGICSVTNCKLTHKVIPERMPDCSYFLQGLCTNSSCPYRHVNVHPKSSICEGFLKGYCNDGDECRKKHSYVCPDFKATGKCLEGASCRLHHPKQRNKSRNKKRNSEQIPRKNRYFVSSVKQACQRCHLRVSPKERSEDILLSEGHYAEYISLDPDSEGDNNVNPVNSHPSAELGSEVPSKWLDDHSSLIKPVRILASRVKI